MYDLVFKSGDYKRLEEIYGRNAVIDVSRKALNDTGFRLRTAVSKQVRNVFNVSAAVVREKAYVARQKGTSQEVTLRYRDYRPNLGRFATSAQKPRVKIKKSRGTKAVKGGFRIERFGPLIWKRLTPEEARSPRYANRKVKIKVLRTIAVPEMVRATSNDKVLQKTVQDSYDQRFNHHFKRRLKLR